MVSASKRFEPRPKAHRLSAAGLLCLLAQSAACSKDQPSSEAQADVDAQAVARQSTTRALVVSLGGDGNRNRSFACGVNSLGAVMCWGENQRLGIGVGDSEKRSTPTPVPGLSSGVASVSVGGSHACALTTRGAVKCWGNAGHYHFNEWDGSASFEGGGIFDGSQELGLGVGVGDGTTTTARSSASASASAMGRPRPARSRLR